MTIAKGGKLTTRRQGARSTTAKILQRCCAAVCVCDGVNCGHVRVRIVIRASCARWSTPGSRGKAPRHSGRCCSLHLVTCQITVSTIGPGHLCFECCGVLRSALQCLFVRTCVATRCSCAGAHAQELLRQNHARSNRHSACVCLSVVAELFKHSHFALTVLLEVCPPAEPSRCRRHSWQDRWRFGSAPMSARESPAAGRLRADTDSMPLAAPSALCALRTARMSERRTTLQGAGGVREVHMLPAALPRSTRDRETALAQFEAPLSLIQPLPSDCAAQTALQHRQFHAQARQRRALCSQGACRCKLPITAALRHSRSPGKLGGRAPAQSARAAQLIGLSLHEAGAQRRQASATRSHTACYTASHGVRLQSTPQRFNVPTVRAPAQWQHLDCRPRTVATDYNGLRPACYQWQLETAPAASRRHESVSYGGARGFCTPCEPFASQLASLRFAEGACCTSSADRCAGTGAACGRTSTEGCVIAQPVLGCAACVHESRSKHIAVAAGRHWPALQVSNGSVPPSAAV